MNKLKVALCVLAVVAIVAGSTALAATQLYVQAPFKYLGHWVFPDGAGGSQVSIRVKNTGINALPVTIEFAGQRVSPPTGGPYTSGATIFDVLGAGQTFEYKFTLPQSVNSLNFIRIRRPVI